MRTYGYVNLGLQKKSVRQVKQELATHRKQQLAVHSLETVWAPTHALYKKGETANYGTRG